MKVEVIIILMVALFVWIFWPLIKEKAIFRKRSNESIMQKEKNIRISSAISELKMTDLLKKQLDCGSIYFAEADTRVINSGVDLHGKRKMTIRSYGADEEMVIDERDVRMY